MKQKYNVSLDDIHLELQKIKKAIGLLLDKEGIRESDLENQRRLKIEADERAKRMMEETRKRYL